MTGSRGTAARSACTMLLAGLALAGSTTAGSATAGAASAAGVARHRPRAPRQVNVSLTGSLSIAWAGDPAHGCASAGLCGVQGSLDIVLDGGESSSSPGPAPLEATDDSAAVRVLTTAADGTVIPCTDIVPVDVVLAVRRIAGRLAATIDPQGSFQPPSAGRCPGPTAADLRGLVLPARRMHDGVDMSGPASMTVGPFALTVESGIRAHITFGSQGDAGPPLLPGNIRGGQVSGTAQKPRVVLEETSRVLYRVTGLTGALTTDFTGAPAPACDALGTCGATGQLVQTFAAHGTLEFAGGRRVARRIGSRQALADLRGGRMPLFDTFPGLPLRQTLTETISQPASACHDAITTAVPNLPADRVRPATVELLLRTGQPFFSGGQGDPFRTRCPGPSQAEIQGGGGRPLAVASIAAGQLGGRNLSVTFRGGGTFGGGAYAGRRSGSLALSLTLVRAGGGTRRVKLYPGEPGVPLP